MAEYPSRPLAPGTWESVFISQPPELSLVFSFLVLALEYIYFLSHAFGLPAQNPRFRSPLMEPPNTPAPRATHISMRLPDTHVLVALPFWPLHPLVLRFSRLLRFGLSVWFEMDFCVVQSCPTSSSPDTK